VNAHSLLECVIPGAGIV